MYSHDMHTAYWAGLAVLVGLKCRSGLECETNTRSALPHCSYASAAKDRNSENWAFLFWGENALLLLCPGFLRSRCRTLPRCIIQEVLGGRVIFEDVRRVRRVRRLRLGQVVWAEVVWPAAIPHPVLSSRAFCRPSGDRDFRRPFAGRLTVHALFFRFPHDTQKS